MKAEDVAAALERQESDGHARLTPVEAATAIRELIEERDRLRDALVEIYGKACLYKMMDAGSEEVSELAAIARAALEPRK